MNTEKFNYKGFEVEPEKSKVYKTYNFWIRKFINVGYKEEKYFSFCLDTYNKNKKEAIVELKEYINNLIKKGFVFKSNGHINNKNRLSIKN